MRLIDSHCHFDDPRLDPDRDAAYRRAAAAGVFAMVIPGVTAAQWPRQREIVASYPSLHAGYGLHPMYLPRHRPEHLDELARWLERERPVALGECGLDYFLEDLDHKAQTELFLAQLRLARDFDLPLILHARRSVDDITKYLRRFPGLRGQVHSFSGSEQQARTLVDMGFKLGFGGAVTWQRAKRLRRLAAKLELNAILLETDAPDQAGALHRGERNEPAFLPEVLETIAQLRDTPPEVIAAAANQNVRELFGI